ncbi:hypothetical protein AB7M47_006633 [Bradyrhizobium elkanii]
MPDFHDPSRLTALGRDWVAAWNARDLERVLSMYAEDAEMTSDRIPPLGFGASGTVRGKASLGPIGARRWRNCPSCISR